MDGNIQMLSRDAVSARMAECFITIEGRRYEFFNIKEFEAKIDKTKARVERLGSVMAGHKTVGMTGTFSGTAHYNQSILRKLMADYKKTGKETYFEIQVSNDDPDSSAGRQTVIFYNCTTDGGVLAKFDAAGEILEEPIAGTFEDFKMPDEFKLLDGMGG